MSFGGDVEVCPTCSRVFPGGTLQCPYDSASLQLRAPTLSRDPLIGATLDGKFTIQSRLGSGGMGVVYVAKQKSLDRIVALKVLAPRDGRETTLEQRFRTEARAASQLVSRHAVTVHDFGVTPEGLLFIAMNLAKGETLRQLLQAGPIPIRDATLIAAQVAEALADAHAHDPQIVHRDIKPDNVIVDMARDNTPFATVLDFGLALLANDPRVTATNIMVGTPAYVAPEQAMIGGNPGKSVDIYALGVTLYEMLCGHPPFQTANSVALLQMHIHERPPRLKTLVPDVSVELDAFVMRMLAKKPEMRPTAADARARLEGIAEGIKKRTAPAPVVLKARKSSVETPVTEPEVISPGHGASQGEGVTLHGQRQMDSAVQTVLLPSVSMAKNTVPAVAPLDRPDRRRWTLAIAASGIVFAGAFALLWNEFVSTPKPIARAPEPMAAAEAPAAARALPLTDRSEPEAIHLALPKSHHSDQDEHHADSAPQPTVSQPPEHGALVDPAQADSRILSEAGLLRRK